MTFHAVFERNKGKWLWICNARALQAREPQYWGTAKGREKRPGEGAVCRAVRMKGEEEDPQPLLFPDSKGQAETQTSKGVGGIYPGKTCPFKDSVSTSQEDPLACIITYMQLLPRARGRKQILFWGIVTRSKILPIVPSVKSNCSMQSEVKDLFTFLKFKILRIQHKTYTLYAYRLAYFLPPFKMCPNYPS